jgi:hypothetical protein
MLYIRYARLKRNMTLLNAMGLILLLLIWLGALISGIAVWKVQSTYRTKKDGILTKVFPHQSNVILGARVMKRYSYNDHSDVYKECISRSTAIYYSRSQLHDVIERRKHLGQNYSIWVTENGRRCIIHRYKSYLKRAALGLIISTGLLGGMFLAGIALSYYAAVNPCDGRSVAHSFSPQHTYTIEEHVSCDPKETGSECSRGLEMK